MIRKLSQDDLMNGFFECLKALTIVGDIENNLEQSNNILNNLPKNINIYVYYDESSEYNENNKVLGTATLLMEQKFIHNGGKVGHIEDVAINKQYQGLGIGKKLILHCLDVAEKEGCYKTILDCSEHNVIFYEKCGFKSKDIMMRYDH